VTGERRTEVFISAHDDNANNLHQFLDNWPLFATRDFSTIINVAAIRSNDDTWVEVRASRQTPALNGGALGTANQYRNQVMVEHSADFGIETTPELVITWVSPSVNRFLGWSPAEMLGRPLVDFAHPDSDENLVQVSAQNAHPENFGMRTQLRVSDGSYKWVTGRKHTLPGTDDQNTGALLFSFQDRQRDELATRNFEQRAEHWQRVLENTSDIVVEIGTDERYRWISPSVKSILGWDPDELVGISPAEIIHPDDLAARDQAAATAVGGKFTVADSRVRTKAGGYRWVSALSRDMRGEHGSYRGRVLTLTDVHHRVLAEERLATAERQLRHVLNNVGDVILRYSPDLTLEWASPSLETVFGWNPSDVVGTAFKMTAPEDRQKARSTLDSAIASTDPEYKNQVRVMCADGRKRWADATFRLVRDDNGAHQSTIIVMRDSTAQVETEELLHSARNHYRMLAENSSDFVIQSDSSGTIEWVSESVTRSMGWEIADLIGSNSFDLVHPEDLTAVADALDLPTDEKDQNRRARLRTPGGDYSWISYSVREIFDAEGNLTKRISGCQIIDSQVASEVALATSEEHFRLMAENSSDFVMKTSAQAVIEWISPSITRVLGWTPQNMIARSRYAFIAPEDRALAREQSGDLKDGKSVSGRLRVLCADGTVRWMSYSANPVFNDANKLVSIVSGYRDIQQEVIAEQARFQSEQRLTLTMQASPVGLALTDLDHRFIEVNPALCELLNTDRDWLLGRKVSDVLSSEEQETVRLQRDAVLRGEQESIVAETRFIRPDGTSVWVSRSLALLRSQDGVPQAYITQLVDISEQRQARVALAQSEQRFRLAMASTPAGLAIVDLDRSFLVVNPALCQMLGRAPEWFLDHAVPDILTAGDNTLDLQMRSELTSSRADNSTRQKRLLHADGTTVWVDHSISMLRDDQGVAISYLSQFVNITETLREQDTLKFQASHDALTHLANRRALLERTVKVLEHPARSGKHVGVMYCDLDNLKTINDTHGHAAGDQVIVAIAKRLVDHVRSDDTVARVGGDEFVIALSAVHSMADLEHLAEKLQAAAAEPVDFQGSLIQPGMSIGMALANHGDHFEAVLQNADSALYQAKRRGGNCAVTYDTAFDAVNDDASAS